MRCFCQLLVCAWMLLAGLSAVPAGALDDPREYAFVATTTAEVIVIDTRQDLVARRFALAGVPAQLLVLEAASILLAVPKERNGVEVFDLKNERRLDPITVGHSVDLLQFDPKRGVLAIASSEMGLITFVQLASRKRLWQVSASRNMTSMIFDPEGEKLFVTSRLTTEIFVVDVVKGSLLTRISVQQPSDAGGSLGLGSIARTPNGWIAFAVPQSPGESVAMVDLRAQSVVKLLSLGRAPSNRGYSTADGAFMILPSSAGRTVSLVSMFSRTEVARLHGGQEMVGVNTGWFETTAFVIDQRDNNVLVIDLIEKVIAGVIRLPGKPGPGATTPDGAKLYVPLMDSPTVAVVDVRSSSLTKLIDKVGSTPRSIHMAANLSFCH